LVAQAATLRNVANATKTVKVLAGRSVRCASIIRKP
jgi:hypothetical protein